MNKAVIAAAAVLVVFAGAQAGSLLLRDEGDATAPPTTAPGDSAVVVVPRAPRPTPRPSKSESGMPEPAAADDSDDTVETVDVTAPPPALVEQLVAAYYTRSWHDASLRAWQDRVLALGDEEMEHGLVHEYGGTPSSAEKAEWRTVIAEPRGTTRVSDVEVVRDGVTEAGRVVFEAEFTVEKMTEAPTTDWTYVFEDTWRVEYAWDGERWLAHSIQVIG